MKATRTRFLLAIMGLSLSVACLNAQPLMKKIVVLSPTVKDTITSGSLLIVITLPESHTAKAEDYKIMLDGKRDISEKLILRKNMLSIIYAEPLEGGHHFFELFEKGEKKEDSELLLVYYFLVREGFAQAIAQKTVPKKPTAEVRKTKFAGSLRLSTADANITGPGAALRQEPASVREVGLDLIIPAGKGEIPIKGFYTTNSQGDFNYRNTFYVGYRKNGSSVSLGDHFVNEDRFTFNGVRVRGLFLDAFIPNSEQKVKIKFMYGKNVDAHIAPNNFPQMPESANTIFQSSIPKYEREYHMLQFYVLHNKYAYGKFSFIRVRDYSDEGLIPGITPMDNMSISWEKYIPILLNRGYVRLNAAMAYTSRNNTLGGSPFDGLIRLNASTVPLSWTGAPQCAFGLAMNIPITKANNLIVDAKRIGHSYFALANPYMLNNRNTLHASDNLRVFKNRVSLNLAYDYMIDNLGKQRPQTRENSSISSSVSIHLSTKLPTLTLGYRYFLSNTYSSLQENFNVKNTGLFGSLNYTLKVEPMTYQFGLSRNDLNLISEVIANSRQEINSISVSAIYKNLAGVSLQGSQTTQYLADITLPQKFVSIQLWYKMKKPEIKFTIRALSNTIKYTIQNSENRKGVQAGVDYALKRYLNIALNAGYMPFNAFIDDRSYVEQFIRVSATIRF